MAFFPPTASRRRILVDSSAFLALRDRDDEHHAEAVAIFSRLAVGRYRLYTTNTMLIESHALILSVLGNRQASRFLQEIDQGSTTVIRVRQSDEERAKQILFRYTDKDFSFNDAISFVVMERLGLSLAFTFDQDFAQYGFSPLQVG
jgi:predicted nucleic acid-binding protein